MITNTENNTLTSSTSSTSSSTTDNIDPGTIQFFDYYIPGLPIQYDSNYVISLRPSLDIPSTDPSYSSNDLPVITQSFNISGPRFSILDADVHAVYPPANSSGQYEQELPFMVFNKRVLPWEIALKNCTPPTINTDAQVPWIALLVLDEGDFQPINGNPVPLNKTTTVNLGTWLGSTSADSTLPAIPVTNLSSNEQNLSCQIICIKTQLFAKIMPNKTELQYLTHCRRINTDDREVLGVKDKGWFSVILSNRFPSGYPTSVSQPTTQYAHLISLEGWEDFLQNPVVSTTSPVNVQLLSLYSWKFTCLPEAKEDFEALMENLVFDKTTNQPVNSPLTLSPLPPDDGSQLAKDTIARISQGYIPLAYHLHTGEDTMAWYRGPFTPNATIWPTNNIPGSQTGGQASIYDTNYGLFDNTYSAAWQLGRSLALADLSFTQTLLNYRWQQRNNNDKQIQRASLEDRGIISKNLDEEMANCTSTGDIPEKLKHVPLANKAFMHKVKQKLVDKVSTIANPPSKKKEESGGKVSTIATPPSLTQLGFFNNPNTPKRKLSSHDRYQKRLEQRTPQLLTITPDNLIPFPNNMLQWLTKLYQLNTVPFYYLIADNRLLPPETIRFFHVDKAWIDWLVDGALSIGIHDKHDEANNQAIKKFFLQPQSSNQDKTNNSSKTSNTSKTSVPVQPVKDEPFSLSNQRPVSGFLLRSQVVSGWPGLRVNASGNSSIISGASINTIYKKSLASDVLLYLFDGYPTQVTISQPQEQMCFGAELDATNNCYISLRNLATDTDKLGTPIDSNEDITLNNFMRAADSRTLDIYPPSPDTGLISAIINKYNTLLPSSQITSLSPSQWAIQMIKAPLEGTFKNSNSFTFN